MPSMRRWRSSSATVSTFFKPFTVTVFDAGLRLVVCYLTEDCQNVDTHETAEVRSNLCDSYYSYGHLFLSRVIFFWRSGGALLRPPHRFYVNFINSSKLANMLSAFQKSNAVAPLTLRGRTIASLTISKSKTILCLTPDPDMQRRSSFSYRFRNCRYPSGPGFGPLMIKNSPHACPLPQVRRGVPGLNRREHENAPGCTHPRELCCEIIILTKISQAATKLLSGVGSFLLLPCRI